MLDHGFDAVERIEDGSSGHTVGQYLTDTVARQIAAVSADVGTVDNRLQ